MLHPALTQSQGLQALMMQQDFSETWSGLICCDPPPALLLLLISIMFQLRDGVTVQKKRRMNPDPSPESGPLRGLFTIWELSCDLDNVCCFPAIHLPAF